MRARRQRGISLIEVLVALLLLSFGLMGMLGLKVAGLKYTGQANSRAAASVHATDILDRMRANPGRAVAGNYNLALDAAAPANPLDVAQVDLAQWRRGIASNLPGGSGSVAVAADGTVRVVLQWTERGDQGAELQTQSFTFDSRL
ncbi:MAG: type IV pilus modification protein PilV [Burkholderiaceae bacterium]|jgi:type IV pilus assembly protein PilV|nr:type IV pilus modification protein PilV [Burkholderiaceae bacterium]